jgi:hypothetical protein
MKTVKKVRNVLFIGLYFILGIASLPLMFVGKALMLIGDTICFCVCMGMAKMLATLNRPREAMLFLKLYRTGKWEDGSSRSAKEKGKPARQGAPDV